MGEGRPPYASCLPVETTKAERERGPAAFSHDLAYAAFGAGRGRDGEEIESRERRGSRKSGAPSQSIVGH